ncbi:MAG: copper homeostasis protein CutC [Bacteroidetes bacterium]|nr:copper homeostasis protein CutC [Bacteroidota bacterium]
MTKVLLEICTFNSTDVVHAVNAGADRIELCASYVEGGITPSHAAITEAFKIISPENIVVMIRPRGGDFIYDGHEFEVMQQDIIHCKNIGVKNVIFGIIQQDGNMDFERNKMLVDLAAPMSCTLQRAFDMTADPLVALEAAIKIGFKRILTSGQEASAWDGRQLIKTLITQSNGRIEILPGAGVNANNAAAIIEFTGCTQIHTSAKMPAISKPTIGYSYKEDIYDFSHLTCVNPDEVAALKKITSSFSA